MSSYRKERNARLTRRSSGAWGTTSQNLLVVTSRLFHLSAAEASSAPDKNYSSYVYAGLPLLLSAIQSFIIEYEGMLNPHSLPEMLSASNGLVLLLESRYGVSGALLDDFRDLSEIRNEIIHPVPLPVGTPDNWPDYLRRVKRMGLLSSSGNPTADYLMFSQMASHALFKWAVETVQKVYSVIVNSDAAKMPVFRRYVGANFQTLFWDLAVLET